MNIILETPMDLAYAVACHAALTRNGHNVRLAIVKGTVVEKGDNTWSHYHASDLGVTKEMTAALDEYPDRFHTSFFLRTEHPAIWEQFAKDHGHT